MNSSDLAKAISIDPRAVILTGALRERVKNSDNGQISGYQPHFTMKGCPLVAFDAAGEPLPSQSEASAIEADFAEVPRPEMTALLASYGRALNMVHLVFGRQGVPANPAESKVLREAGEIFKRHTGQPAHLVTLPVLSTAAYGVAAGRLYALGLFSPQGDALWLNPAAVGVFFKATFSDAQRYRSLTPAPIAAPAPAAPKANWYELMSSTLGKSTGLKGAKLHNLVLSSYADQLLIQGKATDKTSALALAKQEHEAFKASVSGKEANSAPLPEEKPAPKRLSTARV